MRILLTGACGFIGHHVLDSLIRTTAHTVVGLDRIDNTSTLSRIGDISERWTDEQKKKFRFIWHDLRSPINEFVSNSIGPIDVILHLAASTHVDRSISSPAPFVEDNILGTLNILELARKRRDLSLMLYFSTDEVFGTAWSETTFYKEWDRYHATNPYSASKAAGEELSLAYYSTYKVPVYITHTMNVIGERQHPEKYLPKILRALMDDASLPIHVDSTGKVGSRFYLYAGYVADVMKFIIDKAESKKLEYGDKLNIAGAKEIGNIELAEEIAKIAGRKLRYHTTDSDRPGHDLRYALDGTKLKAMGFDRSHGIDESIKNTVQWYLENPRWLLET